MWLLSTPPYDEKKRVSLSMAAALFKGASSDGQTTPERTLDGKLNNYQRSFEEGMMGKRELQVTASKILSGKGLEGERKTMPEAVT